MSEFEHRPVLKFQTISNLSLRTVYRTLSDKPWQTLETVKISSSSFIYSGTKNLEISHLDSL